MIDTNVIIDFLIAREPFYNSALQVIKKCASGEDCLQDRCAENVAANYIITRNTKDFETSIVSAITPEEWLKKFK